MPCADARDRKRTSYNSVAWQQTSCCSAREVAIDARVDAPTLQRQSASVSDRSRMALTAPAAFGKSMTERQDAVSALNGCFDQRDELSQKIQAKMAAERQDCFFLK